ncbi:hypothetical protein LF65_01180 [Clostridium beijerinckii]|uniref:Glycosyl transferase family 1 domain-containing protein n=1 Tax=Clostridium beijerinckii TaxID=1520 RepID=A0A0B5Q6H5_CLOBE|nr:glycosyltransferase family 4 protein [Clostridium beijerinckii]AJG97794.1 hypothetical protein LF65_01180 [Clostridium beijerinckii]
MKSHDIAIIGTYPPPVGGVSVHIKRLTQALNNNSINYTAYNLSKNRVEFNGNLYNVPNVKLWLIKYLFCCKDKIIHCHERNWYLIAILCIIKKIHKSKLLLTLHSFREDPEEFNWCKKLCFFYSMKNIDHFIPVGENERNKLINYISNSGNKISVISSYLRPKYKESDDKLIPQYVWDFINKAKFLISANGCIRFYRNQDLYGIDMLIELCKNLKSEGYNVSFLIAILCKEQQNDNERSYYYDLKKKIKEYKLGQDIMLYEVKDTEFYPILRRSKLFLRPTNTDAYGVSIAEALCYQVPSIASNVCKRPEGTIVFKSRNIDDLHKNVIRVIDNYSSYKEQINNINIEDNGQKLLSLYKDLII